MTTVKYIKLHPNAIPPTKGTDQAAAYDLYAIEDAYIPRGVTLQVGTGISLQIPEGWKGEVYSRSGLASQGIVVANSPGKIDSDYRGEIKVLLRNDHTTDLVGIKTGDRIAQFEINPVHPIEFEQSQDLDFTSRGDQGFGSTGK